MCAWIKIHKLHICSFNTNSCAPTQDSEDKFFVLAVYNMETGALKKPQKNKNLIKNGDQKTLDITINMSHNKTLSDKDVIQLVKLLARKAAEEDYMQSITDSKSRW